MTSEIVKSYLTEKSELAITPIPTSRFVAAYGNVYVITSTGLSLAELPLKKFTRLAAWLLLSSRLKRRRNWVSPTLLIFVSPLALKVALYQFSAGVVLNAPTLMTVAALLKSISCRAGVPKGPLRRSTHKLPKTVNGLVPTIAPLRLIFNVTD